MFAFVFDIINVSCDLIIIKIAMRYTKSKRMIDTQLCHILKLYALNPGPYWYRCLAILGIYIQVPS